mmetsp:Transcript_28106/g.78822  ORF Transcript_28106/g.78822 Transcript_28106/m.78822 type:complete len:105 (-) Transcript_28106:21-335(-)
MCTFMNRKRGSRGNPDLLSTQSRWSMGRLRLGDHKVSSSTSTLKLVSSPKTSMANEKKMTKATVRLGFLADIPETTNIALVSGSWMKRRMVRDHCAPQLVSASS